jgi:hypothetical protein
MDLRETFKGKFRLKKPASRLIAGQGGYPLLLCQLLNDKTRNPTAVKMFRKEGETDSESWRGDRIHYTA